jgi:hypothetical protein
LRLLSREDYDRPFRLPDGCIRYEAEPLRVSDVGWVQVARISKHRKRGTLAIGDRWSQIAMSVVGITVYVFALGGWFATTTWYHQWYASIVVPVFGLVIAILKLPPLPADPNAPPTAAPEGKT